MVDGFIKVIKKGKKEFKNCLVREVEIFVEEVEENNLFIFVFFFLILIYIMM